MKTGGKKRKREKEKQKAKADIKREEGSIKKKNKARE
jgi:hypothetical protein